ncbi:MAG: hypothetical protein BMS9Abin09_0577 [Gammaproteobacteria bacterium]|nr:MAG: hypothetical protein BMS9Abin09_0577 [Gammaproteobacteria bacterium]
MKESLINPSCRRKPASNALNLMDSGLRRNDDRRFNQGILKLPVLLAGLLCSATAFGGEVYVAAVSHQSGSYLIEVDTLVQMDEPQVRSLLTDYNNLGRVNPAIEISEVLLTRGPGDYRVRTVTEACIWFYCMRVHQVQDVIESQDGTVTALVVPEQSDFRYGYARLNLWQEAEGTRILIRSEVEPDFWIPPLIGPWLIKRKLLSETLETVDNLEQLAKTPSVPHN